MNKFLGLILLAVLGLASLRAAPGDPITYAVSLVSTTYSPDTDTTRFTYWVTSNPGGGPAISHWVIAIDPSCGNSSVLVGSNDPLVSWTNSDPTTGVRGIKFDTGYADLESRTVTLTLAGRWTTGEVTIAVKSGKGFVLGTTQGPVCGSTEVMLHTLAGVVYFDANYNSSINPGEIGIGGVTVTLLDAAGHVVESTTTGAAGAYSFTVPTGNYTVIVGGVNGMLPTTLTEHDLAISSATTVPDTGFGLNFSALGTMSASGFTIGFWKTNLEKALKGTTKGVQVDAATLARHTGLISNLALAPYTGLTLNGAAGILSRTDSAPAALLAKPLLAADYNYANGAYLNGDARLTYFFIHYGEYVLQHAATYGSTSVLNVKDWMDAYNNTHGGLVIGPAN